jgi:hypothetical protein
MFNTPTYQGGTATIDGQPAGMNGHSRIPEYAANGVVQNTLGAGYPQTFGYPNAFPGFSAQTVINPMTGIPVMTPGYAGFAGAIPTINPVMGYNGVGGIPSFVNGQYAINTPWALGGNYPTAASTYNTIPATTFGVPAVQSHFGTAFAINPLTGAIQPTIITINPFTGFVQPMGLNTPVNNPFVTNPWMNPTTTFAAPAFPGAFPCVPQVAAPTYFNNPAAINGAINVADPIGVNAAFNPVATVAAVNPAVCGCPTGVATPAFINNTINRSIGINPMINPATGFGYNPIINSATGFGYNPITNVGMGWNPAIAGGYAPFAGATTTPWNTVGATPWNAAGVTQNPWINAFPQGWPTGTNLPNNPFTHWMNPTAGFATPTATPGFGWNVGAPVTPGTHGLVGTTGCWPTYGI